MPPKKLGLEPVDLGPTRVVHASSSRSDGTIPGRLVRCYQCGKEYGVCMGDLSRGRGIFCSRQCSGLYRRRSPIEILETYTCKTDTCWLWTGPADPLGYGHVILADGTRWLAHRLSWHIYRGPIPKGIEVCHNCPGLDNPACVRPEHLFLGTHADNMADMVRKGRQQKGERNGHAILTYDQVVTILNQLKAGMTPTVLGRAYGVTRGAIESINNGDNWKHVPRP